MTANLAEILSALFADPTRAGRWWDGEAISYGEFERRAREIVGQQDVARNALVTQARQNDAGMARLVLAAAFEQAPGWPSGATEPAPTDYLTQGNLIGNPQFVHKEIEVMAGGAMTWNHGVDFTDLLNRSGSIDRVRFWYERAGLDLNADLATLASAPRFAAKPSVVEDKGTMNGRVS